MSAVMTTSMALESPRGVLLGAKGWAGVAAAAITIVHPLTPSSRPRRDSGSSGTGEARFMIRRSVP